VPKVTIFSGDISEVENEVWNSVFKLMFQERRKAEIQDECFKIRFVIQK